MSRAAIVDLEVSAVLIPIKPPHRVAGGLLEFSPLLLIDLHFDDGVCGHAIVFTYTPAAQKPLGDFLLNLKPVLLGEASEPAVLNTSLRHRFRLLGTQGFVGMALAGIDMAAWDAQAKRQEQSISQLTLRADTSPVDVKAYGGTGYDGERETAKQAEAWAKQGFKGIKAKIGYPTVEEDIKVVRAMRHAVGPDVALMVDYNQSLSAETAVERLRQIDEEGLTWIEEPVLAHDFATSAAVAAELTTPVQSGENWWGELDMQQALSTRASDLVMPDVMKIGGVTGWLASVKHAEAANIPVSSHLWPELSAQLLRVGKTSHWLEYVDWWNPILKTPLEIEDGYAKHDESCKGSGIEWNLKAVEQYRC